MLRNLDTGPRVRRSSYTSWPQGVEQKGKGRGERRKRRWHTRMAPQGDISLHLVQHGKRATGKVATQNKEKRNTRMPMPPRPRTSPRTRTIGRAPGGKVQSAHKGEKSSREKGTTGVEVSTYPDRHGRKEGKRASRAREN